MKNRRRMKGPKHNRKYYYIYIKKSISQRRQREIQKTRGMRENKRIESRE